MLLCVITPSTGDPRVLRAIKSVDGLGIRHMIVADGPEAARKLAKLGVVPSLCLPEAVGKHGWNAHRVYGALPWLTNSKYVTFLDEDNFFVNLDGWLNFTLLHDLEWSCCLRNVYDTFGNFVAHDTFESIGALARDGFVDTNCYMLKRDVAIQCSVAWNRPFRLSPLEADGVLYNTLMERFPTKMKVYPKYCLNYVAGSTPSSVKPSFFEKNVALPKEKIFIFHFNKHATQLLFEGEGSVFDEWSLRIYDDFMQTHTAYNGYTQEFVPANSICVFTLCHASDLPRHIIDRRDIKKILFAFESPNIRHTEQWDVRYLNHFDVVLSYWDHVAAWPSVIPSPQFCHPATKEDYVENESFARDVCIVLENRGTVGEYTVCNRRLNCLDALRGQYAYGLANRGVNVTAYGTLWEARDKLRVGDCGEYTRANGNPHQLLKRHTFAIIVENCDAEGYVSEKIFDAFCAGCIPLYYGNLNHLVTVDSDMYVDLKKDFNVADDTSSLRRLSAYLQTIDVPQMKSRILQGRDAVMAQISSRRFANLLDNAMEHRMDKTIVLPPTTVLRTFLPRHLFVFVGQHLRASVRKIYTTGTEEWEEPWITPYLKAYNQFFNTNKTRFHLCRKITGAYAVNWHIFNDSLSFALSCESKVTPYSPSLLFALSVSEIKIEELNDA